METSSLPIIASSELLDWLRGRLADAEQALSAREAMANQPKISDEEWELIKAMPGARVTKARKLSKAALNDIAQESLRHKRIAQKCLREVEMFRAAIAVLTPSALPTPH